MLSQLWVIGGGEVHESRISFLDALENSPVNIGEPYYNWKSWISLGLADRMQTIKPDFPNTENADYDAWKIWFEKYIQKYISKDIRVTIIAHSLGGIFIAKYLSENTFPLPIETIHFIAPVFNDTGLDGEVVGNFAFDPKGLTHLIGQTSMIHLWHSKDDPIVPYDHSLQFQKFLPQAVLHTFQDRGHFVNQSHFIELFSSLLS